MNELGVAKLRGVFRRRKIPILAAAVGILGVGAAIVWQMDPAYKASAVIRAGEVQPAKEYVAPTVAEQIGERLKSLRLAVMARPIVAEACKRLKLYDHWKKPPEMLVDDLRSRMDVKLEGEDTFLLTYADSNPERAKAIVNQVATLFMQHTVDERQKVASATTQAIRTEVESLQPQLADAEKAVREFKMQHYGALPEQQESNLRTLDQTTMELNIASTNLDLDQERRRQLLTAALSPLRRHEETLAGRLYEARSKYTEDNPEVQNILVQYEKVKNERVAEERDLTAKLRHNNPELVALEGEIARTKSIVEGLRKRQSTTQQRVEQTAKNGQSLAGLLATYDGLKEKYGTTLSRLRDAELAERIESGLSSLRFDLVEGASLPTSASGPSRALMSAAVLLLALLGGLGLGFALDATDRSVRDAEQLRTYAPSIPILASIPRTKTYSPKAEA